MKTRIAIFQAFIFVLAFENVSVAGETAKAGRSASRSSQAAPVEKCTGTLAECEELLRQIQAELQVLRNGAFPAIDQDLVRVTDESKSFCKSMKNGICFMTQAEAIDYCFAQGKHLPTARELALFATSKMKPGTGGLIEKKEYDELVRDGKDVSGYSRYVAKNPSGKTDDIFYFDYRGYKKEAGDLGKYGFWSSSFSPYSDYFYLNGYNGVIGIFGRNRINAVRCVAGR